MARLLMKVSLGVAAKMARAVRLPLGDPGSVALRWGGGKG
jgi:hypothetical protein